MALSSEHRTLFNQVVLIITSGALSGKRHVFEHAAEVMLGRGEDCAVRLPESRGYEGVSRQHCRLVLAPPEATIQDLGSKNGTQLNGVDLRGRPRPTPLQDGDIINVGRTTLRVEIWRSVAPRRDSEQRDSDHSTPSLGMPALPDSMALVDLSAYMIDKPLGRGVAGEVFLAQEQASGRQVAIKTLHEHAGDALGLRSFIREIENLTALKHRNIVQLLAVGLNGQNPFLVLEYCNRGSLDTYRAECGGYVPLGEAVRYLMQVLDGLEFAHSQQIEAHGPDGRKLQSQGFVHRDLKPGNILLHEENGVLTAKIADFGLGKAAGAEGYTATGSVSGTPTYMPRQQVLDYKYAQPEVDVWAAAACFFRVVTGDYPKPLGGGTDPWMAALTVRATPIRQLRDNVPTPLAEVIDEALVDNPEIRIKSAAELKRRLLDALRRIKGGA
jgi:serine/threonine protein kinase